MKFLETEISDCYKIIPNTYSDHRGSFVKVYQQTSFARLGLEQHFKEEFYTTSSKNVFRGLHFQIPPHAQNKLVFCTQGRVIDYIADLRIGSPTYAKVIAIELDANVTTLLYVGKGLAHGFFAMSEQATLCYKVSEEYSPEHDHGIHYRSVNIQLPNPQPILSDRDLKFPSLDEYKNPFKFQDKDLR